MSFAQTPKTGQAPGAAPDGSWNSRAVQEHNREALAGYSGDLSTMTVMRDAVPVVIAQTEIGNFTVAHRSMHDAQRHQQQLERASRAVAAAAALNAAPTKHLLGRLDGALFLPACSPKGLLRRQSGLPPGAELNWG